MRCPTPNIPEVAGRLPDPVPNQLLPPPPKPLAALLLIARAHSHVARNVRSPAHTGSGTRMPSASAADDEATARLYLRLPLSNVERSNKITEEMGAARSNRHISHRLTALPSARCSGSKNRRLNNRARKRLRVGTLASS